MLIPILYLKLFSVLVTIVYEFIRKFMKFLNSLLRSETPTRTALCGWIWNSTFSSNWKRNF